MSRKHSIDVGPSSAHRWSVCTASPSFIVANADKLPDDSSVFADEGTLAHDYAKKILLGEQITEEITPEMLNHVMAYVTFVRSHGGAGAKLEVERKVPLFYNTSRNGIVDASTLKLTEAIYIDDLKYGVGVSVEAEGNEQLAIYGESKIREWETIMDVPSDIPVHLSIFQPRDRNNPEPVRTWTLTRRELSAFTTPLGAKARNILAGGQVEFQPSDKACRFCPAKGFCSARATDGLVALPEEVRPITLPQAESLTREQRVKVLAAKKALRDWLEDVEQQEMQDLLTGAEPQGFKIVEGKANREWSDIEAAQKLLSNHLTIDITRPRVDLISPAQAEKALKGVELSARFQNKMKSLITRPSGKPTLVPEDDPRPSIIEPKNQLDNLDVI